MRQAAAAMLLFSVLSMCAVGNTATGPGASGSDESGSRASSKGHGPPDPPTSTAGLDSAIMRLPGKINAGMKDRRLAGLSVAIVRDRDVIYSGAFGFADVDKELPVTEETIYPIASVTKVFTATMLAQLCEKGTVTLETPVREYLPEYQVKSTFPGTGPTTLSQLASHTSGLPQDAPNNFWCNYSMFGWVVTGGQAEVVWYVTKEELLAALSSVELEYPPDIYSHYSNLGMQVLGMALERATEESFTDYIASHILQPLGMEDSGFVLDEAGHSRLASGYVCLSPDAPLLTAPMWEPGCALYSGGMYSTAEDMARFISMQFQVEAVGGPQILSAGGLRLMRSPNSIRKVGEYDSYGLGWGIVRIADHDAIEHNGALLGHDAHVSAIPALKLGIVMLANSRNYMWPGGGAKDLAREIYEDLIPAIQSAGEEAAFDPEGIDLAGYEGKYSLPNGIASMEMSARDGALVVSIVEDPEFNEAFTPLSRYEFCFAADPSRTPLLFFQADNAGRIESASFLAYAFKRMD